MVNETLDPKDWQALTILGKKMVEDMMSHIQKVTNRKVWEQAPEETKQFFKQDVPQEGHGEEETYKEFREKILPHSLGCIHPRFLGWFTGSGFPYAALADMLTSGINTVSGAANQPGLYVELQVIQWFKQIMGYPENASGVMVSGASMSNFVGLNVARDSRARLLGINVRNQGLQALPRKLIYYCSTQTHSSVDRAIQILGLGDDSLRKIDVDDNYRIDLDKLQKAIEQDFRDKNEPTCVIGNAGTIATGAYDDLMKLSKIAKKHNLWFHVDGAFGALVTFSEKLKHLVNGIEQTDSLCFDLHKWMHIPYEAALSLVKNKRAHFDTYNIRPDYLATRTTGITAGEWLSDYGLQLSRRFNALKVWMSIYAYGIKKFGRMIEKSVELAHYLEKLVNKSGKLQLIAPVSLNIVCLRYVDEKLSEDQLNELNKELLFRLQNSGIAVPSNKRLRGKYCIRVAITSHRTQQSDLETVVSEIEKIGDMLVSNSKKSGKQKIT
jgi:glutamate/tyrosine decarboxylase-like PLP-dependent enzyme